MRIDPLSTYPMNYVTVPANVTPVKNATQAPKSGLRPQDLNALLKSMVNSKNALAMKLVSITYNQKGQMQNTLAQTLPELFIGNNIDTRA